MLLKSIISKFYKHSVANDDNRMIEGPIKDIVVLIDSKNSPEQTEDLRKALSGIEEDYSVSFYDSNSNEITTDLLKSYDFIINAAIAKKNDHLERILIQSQVKKGLLTDHILKPDESKRYQMYDVIWFFNFDGVDKLKHPRKFHAYSYVSEHSGQPNWDIPYYGRQIKKGLMSVIKDRTRISKRLYSKPLLKVGKDSFYNSKFQIIGKASFVEIGSYCSFGNNIKLYTTNHDTNYPTTQGYLYRKYFGTDHPGEVAKDPSRSRTKGPIIIKNDVWIGDDVKIMSGVTIGNGACIAAGSVVTKDIGDYEIVGGVPAQLIRFRFSNQMIEYLNDIKWWDWSDSKIQRNKSFFELNLNEINAINELKINP